MGKKLVVGGAVGLAVVVGAVVAVATLPAQADPQPAEVIGIHKVSGDYREVRKQIQNGNPVDPTAGGSAPAPGPTPDWGLDPTATPR